MGLLTDVLKLGSQFLEAPMQAAWGLVGEWLPKLEQAGVKVPHADAAVELIKFGLSGHLSPDEAEAAGEAVRSELHAAMRAAKSSRPGSAADNRRRLRRD